MSEVVEIGEYGMNKQLMARYAALTEKTLVNEFASIAAWISYKKNQYFWLTNRELIDQLLFHMVRSDFHGVSVAIQEELAARGEILSIAYSEERDCYDIWIRREDDECFLYYLYPYDDGVIEV